MRLFLITCLKQIYGINVLYFLNVFKYKSLGLLRFQIA